MQTRQAKTQNPKPVAESAELTKKVASSAAHSTRLPAWANAWGDQPPAALISPVADLQAKHLLSQPEDPDEQQADHIANHVMDMAASSLSLPAAPPDHPGALPPVAASLSHVPPIIQRAPLDDSTASTPTESTPTPATASPATAPETASPALIVEDSAEQLAPGQMKKSAFLAQLYAAVSNVAGNNASVINDWFDNYSKRSSKDIEQTIHTYIPEAAQVTTAVDYIPLIQERVRQSTGIGSQGNGVSSTPASASPEIPASTTTGGAETVSSKASNAMLKGREGSSVASTPLVIQSQLGAGQLLEGGVKSRMESAFGMDFSHVRTHTDARSEGLSNSLNARAFTVGAHVAFGPGEYQPGSLVGDALIAHELAHVVQQRGANQAQPVQQNAASYSSLEEDADMSAVGAIASLWSGARGVLSSIAQNALPNLRSGLRLQRCRSQKEIDDTRNSITNLIGKPEANADEVIRNIDSLGGDASEVLMQIAYNRGNKAVNETILNALAGSEGGQKILEKMSQVLKKGDPIARSIVAPTIDTILKTRRSAAPAQLSQELKGIIDRITQAIDADSQRRKQYLEETKPPLRLPVKIYQSGQEMLGGVYYDPSMPTELPGDAGRTITSGSFRNPWQPGAHTQFPLVYIKLGPIALKYSNNFISSVLWHEFEHYKQILEYRNLDTKTSTDDRLKILEEEYSTVSPTESLPNSELEATSVQLSDDFERLTDDEVQAVLSYLADHMANAKAKQSFKDAAISRIKGAVRGKRNKQRHNLLFVIRKLGRKDQSNLKALSDAIQTDRTPATRHGGSQP